MSFFNSIAGRALRVDVKFFMISSYDFCVKGLELKSCRGESLVIGRALACGYNLFFKAWRDSKYDAVLDAVGQLFRVEIKQSGDGTQLSCTSGGRSGAQISLEAAYRATLL